jgi:hypothetical protein
MREKKSRIIIKYTEYTTILQNNERMSPARGHNT